MRKVFIASTLAIFGAISLFSADIEVENIRARTSKPGTNNSAIFMNIKNNLNTDVRLVEVSSSVCKSTEMHTHKELDGMKQMVQIDEILIGKNSETKLVPGGLHIMLMGLNAPIKEGDKVDLQMKFDNGEVLKFDAINVTANFK